VKKTDEGNPIGSGPIEQEEGEGPELEEELEPEEEPEVVVRKRKPRRRANATLAPPPSKTMLYIGILIALAGLAGTIVITFYDSIKGDEFSLDTIGELQMMAIVGSIVLLVIGIVITVMGERQTKPV